MAQSRTTLIAAAIPPSPVARYMLGCSCLLMVATMGVFMTLCAGFTTLAELLDDPVIAVVSAFNAVALGIPYLLVVLWLDRNEKEPVWLLASAFCWGAVMSTGLSLIFNTSFALFSFSLVGNEFLAHQMTASFSAPLVEEGTKGLALFLLYGFFRKHFDNILDGVIYGAVVGLGFAVFENFIYYAQQPDLAGVYKLTLLRGILAAVGSHACFTALTGASLGWFRVLRRGFFRWFIPPLGLATAMFAHFAWNTFTLIFLIPAGSNEVAALLVSIPLAVVFLQGPFVLLVVTVAMLALRHERKLIEKYLRDEKEPIMYAEELGRLVPARRRACHSLKLILTFQLGAWWRTRRRNTRLIRLAFEKWHMDRHAEDGFAGAQEYAVRVQQLRSELKELQPV